MSYADRDSEEATMARETYARSIGLRHTDRARSALRNLEMCAGEALRWMEHADSIARPSGYARTACLHLALYALRGLLAVIRHDLERVGGGGER
jgi:hypothetical protein